MIIASHRKASAWKWAAELIERECEELEKRGESTQVSEHARHVVAKSMHRQAELILGGTKAKREAAKP